TESGEGYPFSSQLEAVFSCFSYVDGNSLEAALLLESDDGDTMTLDITHRCLHIVSSIVRICLMIIHTASTCNNDAFIKRSSENLTALALALEISGIVCAVVPLLVDNCKRALRLQFATEDLCNRHRIQAMHKEQIAPGTPSLHAHAMAHINGVDTT